LLFFSDFGALEKAGRQARFAGRQIFRRFWGSGGMLAALPGIGDPSTLQRVPVSSRSFGEQGLGRECSA
jgi:hypothetical protein